MTVRIINEVDDLPDVDATFSMHQPNSGKSTVKFVDERPFAIPERDGDDALIAVCS